MNKAFQKMLIYFLCFMSLVVNTKNASAATINEGDLVKTKTSSAIYLIQNGKKRVFPHSSVYLSWGYPSDYSVVKTITDVEMTSLKEDSPVIYRDGLTFRFKGTSMPGGFDPSAVFFVSDGKVRPIESATAYMELFNGGVSDSKIWDKVYWIPKDLLSKFTYEKGENITSNQIKKGELPNGLVLKTSAGSFSIVKDGRLNEITTEGLFANRYLTNEKIFDKMIAPKIDPIVLGKISIGGKITTADTTLLTVRDLNVTMLPPENTIGNTDSTGTISNNDTTPVVNTTPLAPTNVVPLSKPQAEDPFVLTSVLMKDDSDRVINIVFNKDVQANSAKNKTNYTFKKIDGTILNSLNGGGNKIDSNGHPLTKPVIDSNDNKKVIITLGDTNEDKSAISPGTYKLCVSNIKTANGGIVLSETCKQFNVLSNIRPTLYSNSGAFESNINYSASNNKILIKYSEEMGSSAINASNYKIRDFKVNNANTITTWLSLSSSFFSGIELTFLNNNKDVLISFPSKISFVASETDFMIGYMDGTVIRSPKDINGNNFKETTNNTSSLIGENIIVDMQSMELNNAIEFVEVFSPTEVDVIFKRELSWVRANEFLIRNINNPNGFIPTSVTIDSEDERRAKFVIDASYGFTSSDTDSKFGIKLSNNNIKTITTKDILGLNISNTGNKWVIGSNNGSSFGYWENKVVKNKISFISHIGIKIDSFVLADPYSIYLKFDGNLGLPSDQNNDALELADDLVIQQGNVVISGKSNQTKYNFYGSGNKDGLMSVFYYGNSTDVSYYGDNMNDITNNGRNDRDIVRLIFSPGLDANQDIIIRTVKSDNIKTFGSNLADISEDLSGVTNEKFAAYRIDKGFSFYENPAYITPSNLAKFTSPLINGYGFTLKAQSSGSHFNGMHINIIDDDSVSCYDDYAASSVNYRSTMSDYSMAGINWDDSNGCSTINSTSILSKITGGYPNFELKCDINNTSRPLTLCDLTAALQTWDYTNSNIISEEEYRYILDYIQISGGSGYETDVTPVPEMDMIFSGGTDDYFRISPTYKSFYNSDSSDFLLVKFNGDVDLSSLSSYGSGWSRVDDKEELKESWPINMTGMPGVSYGLEIPDSLIINPLNDKITFNNINLGEFYFSEGIENQNNENLILNARYIYNLETKTLGIKIYNIGNNQYRCDNNPTDIYNIKYDGIKYNAESKIIYTPSSNIKNINGISISTKFKPTMYIPVRAF